MGDSDSSGAYVEDVAAAGSVASGEDSSDSWTWPSVGPSDGSSDYVLVIAWYYCVSVGNAGSEVNDYATDPWGADAVGWEGADAGWGTGAYAADVSSVSYG